MLADLFLALCFVLIALQRVICHNDIPIILWWTKFANTYGILELYCPNTECYVTEDRSVLENNKTKAVVFYGSDFKIDDLPLPRKTGQWWALLHEESPKNQPLFDHYPILQLFNLTSTFKRNSSLPLTLQYLESANTLLARDTFVETDKKNNLGEQLAPIIYIQSDCDAPSERDKYVAELSKFIKIDSYGECLHNMDLPLNLQNRMETFNHEELRSLIAKYKFSLAIENAACDDYITEKLWRPLSLGCVPIYWGSRSVRDWLPNKNSIIHIRDYSTPESLALEIKRIMKNDVLYESYLEHKIQQKISNEYLLKTLKARTWKTNSAGYPNFISEFECLICREINFKYHSYKPGQLLADTSHYGCPEPESVLTGVANSESFWVELWHKAKAEAYALKKLVEAEPGTFSLEDVADETLQNILSDKYFENYGGHEEL